MLNVRSAHSLHPNAINAMYYRTYKTSPLDVLRVAIPCILLFPLRVLLILLGALLLALVSLVASVGIGNDLNKPISQCRRSLCQPARLAARIILLGMGFWWISVKGKPVPASQARIVVSNHISVCDAFILGYLLLPSFVGKAELLKVPIIGSIMRILQCIAVDRTDEQSRKKTFDAIQQRANLEMPWGRLVIFPEGTVSNGEGLIRFKPGAFAPMAPVLPVCIRYHNKFMDPSITSPMDLGPITLHLMCQWYNSATITFLDVASPGDSIEPSAFANAVRSEMQAALKCPLSDCTYDDEVLKLHAMKKKYYPPAKLHLVVAEMGCVQDKWHLSCTEAKSLLDRYAELDQRRNGCIAPDDLCIAMWGVGMGTLAEGHPLPRLFFELDVDKSGAVSFWDYVRAACAHAGREGALYDLLHGKYESKFDDFVREVFMCPDIPKDFISKLFREVDVDADGIISIQDCQQWAKRCPEYSLFVEVSKGEQKS